MSNPVNHRARDLMDREFGVNDTIVYPVRRGSKLWMAVATVTQVLPTPGESSSFLVHALTKAGRRVAIKNLQNVVKV
jgi:hypothetical protein